MVSYVRTLRQKKIEPLERGTIVHEIQSRARSCEWLKPGGEDGSMILR